MVELSRIANIVLRSGARGPGRASGGPPGQIDPEPPASQAFATIPRLDQHVQMIFGAHLVLVSEDADADRSFLATMLGLQSVDAGGGWLIFELPPAEVAVHPGETTGADLYLMCDDLSAEMTSLSEKGVVCSEVEEARWGSITKITLPGGGQVGLYKPRHPLAIGTDS